MDLTANDAKSDSILLCPVCNAALSRQTSPQNHEFVCSSNHSFDVAKEGYVNLLRLKKQPKFLGDSKGMLGARRLFLDAGHYAPLGDQIGRLISNHSSVLHGEVRQEAAATYRILDAGCGEGYYLRHSVTFLQPVSSIEYLGMDIAKDGPRLAAKQLRHGLFFVADVNQPLLLPNAAIDTLLNIFAPRNPKEFARVLKPTGQLVVVIPMDGHLSELRAEFDLLGIQADKETVVINQMAAVEFVLTQSEKLSFPLSLNRADLLNLLHMTPSHRRPSNGQVLASLDSTINELAEPIRTTASFQILVFKTTLNLR